jgi:tetratricopeptide (TPR) repeat protein
MPIAMAGTHAGSFVRFNVGLAAALLAGLSAELVYGELTQARLVLSAASEAPKTGEIVDSASDPRSTLLVPVVLIDERTEATESNGNRRFGRVRSLRSGSEDRWVSMRYLTSLDALPAPTGGAAAGAPLVSDDIPEVIRLQPPEVIRAWREVQTAIAENGRLAQPMAEPYFARAEILTVAQDFDSALRDYLRAVQIASQSGQDVAIYAAYFNRLCDALEAYDRAPRPPASGDALWHYGAGVHSFRAGQLSTARGHFTNAIALDNEQPLYWYFRALTNQRLGDSRRADHDALIGAHVEWKDGEPDALGSSLVHVQGDLRRWLQGHRRGNPMHQILR